VEWIEEEEEERLEDKRLFRETDSHIRIFFIQNSTSLSFIFCFSLINIIGARR